MSNTTLYMFSGETKTVAAVITDEGVPVDISVDHEAEFKVVRGDDPDAVVILKSTSFTGDDIVDVTSEGASGRALASLVVADTDDLEPEDYKAQWKVTNTSINAVKKQQFTIKILRGI